MGKGKVNMVCPWAMPEVLHAHMSRAKWRGKAPDLYACQRTESGNMSKILDLWWTGRAPGHHTTPLEKTRLGNSYDPGHRDY